MMANRVIWALLLSLLFYGCMTPKQPELGEPLAGLTREQRAQFQERCIPVDQQFDQSRR